MFWALCTSAHTASITRTIFFSCCSNACIVKTQSITTKSLRIRQELVLPLDIKNLPLPLVYTEQSGFRTTQPLLSVGTEKRSNSTYQIPLLLFLNTVDHHRHPCFYVVFVGPCDRGATTWHERCCFNVHSHCYLDSSRDVQMQLVSKRTNRLKRSHVLHVANPPGMHRQEKKPNYNTKLLFNSSHGNTLFSEFSKYNSYSLINGFESNCMQNYLCRRREIQLHLLAE